LKRQSHPHTQQLILPYNSLVAYLLQEYGNPVAANLIATHQQA
jgi:hypothetical protein